MKPGERSARALLAGEADFDALCAAGGMESDELGALLIEMEMDGWSRLWPGRAMRRGRR